MATKKKISINAFENVMKERYIPTETVNWHGIEVTITKTLSFKDMMEFADGVAKICFAKDTQAYIPEVKDFAIKKFVLEKYANFTMPQNVANQYALIYQTNAVEVVLEYINLEQYNELICSIDKKIDNLAKANIEAINKQMSELQGTLENLVENFSSIFSGVEAADMNTLLKAFNSEGLAEEKIVQAYLKQSKGNE